MSGEPTRARARLAPGLWLFGDAAIAALVAGPAETLLLFLLSPEIPLTLGGFAATLWALLPQITVVYVVLAPALVMLGLALRVGKTARRGLSVRYVLRFLLFDTALLTGAAAYQWSQLGFLLPDAARVALALTTTSLGAAALIALVLSIVDARRPGVVGKPWLLALCIGLVVSLTAAATLRRVKVEPPQPIDLPGFAPLRDLLLVEFPALGGDDLDLYMERGSVGAMESLQERGARVALEGGAPANTISLHATLATGQGPAEHGVVSSVRYRPRGARRSFGVFPRALLLRPLLRTPLWERIPVRAGDLRVPSLPGIAASLRIPLARVGVPLEPRRTPPGSLSVTSQSLRPGEKVLVGARPVSCPDEAGAADRFLDPPAEDLPSSLELGSILEASLEADRCALAIARAALEEGRWPIVHLRLGGHYRVAYQFAGWRQDRPARGVADREIRAYGRVLTRYVRELDPELGALFEAAGEDALIALASPHGIRAREDAERLLAELIGRTAPTGTHAGPPPGVLVLAGPGVRSGQRVERSMQLESLLPTILWALGLPVAADMGGEARALFEEEFVRDNPVIGLPSYGAPAKAP